MEDREPMQNLADVFSHPGYRRLFDEIERKWISLARFAGNIKLPCITEEESQKLTGLLGERVEPGSTLTIRLSVLQQKLLRTRWAVGLETLVPLITGRPLVSNKQRVGQKRTAWEQFCDRMKQRCQRKESSHWWEGIREGTAPVARTVKTVFAEDPELAESLASLCLRALDELPCWSGGRERLPVFANRLSGDPHALDADRPAGRWLYQAICFLFELGAEGTTEWKREVWQEAGLLLDDISSFVTVAGVRTLPGDRWEAFFETAYVTRMPLLLPLAFFQERLKLRLVDRVYVVENPAVMQSLLDRWPTDVALPPLVCTSGQPSVAALRLLDAYWESGAEIWYSGDFDLKGIEMACSLQKRYGDRFLAWRMGREEYLAGKRGLSFAGDQEGALLELQIGWDEELGAAIRDRREKVFQESFVTLLLSDMLGESVGSG